MKKDASASRNSLLQGLSELTVQPTRFYQIFRETGKRVTLGALCIVALTLAASRYGIVPFHIPKGWPTPVYTTKNNPLTPDGILLGRVLFYDPVLSADSTVSCASCHSPYNAFAHTDHAVSHGIRDSIGLRNAPTLVNLAWQSSFMHDGAIHHLDMVPLAPISHPGEMGTSISSVVNRLKLSGRYPTLYAAAFGSEEITGERTLKALSQFLLTLVSASSRYDRVMEGREQFTEQEEKGYLLFRKQCATCHTEPLFTNGKYYNTGLSADSLLRDEGRKRITGREEDAMTFKVPTLRNIEFTPPYMHDGRFSTLSKVLQHYTSGIHAYSNLAPQLQQPITLSAHDKADIIAFLQTLSDKEFVFDSRHQYPFDLFHKKP